MLSESFERLPDDADVWIYAADARLGSDAVSALERALDDLMSAWSSHGRRVLGARTVLYDRVAVVGASVADGTISGCGIDKSLHVLDRVAAEHGFEWVDGLSVVYRSREGDLRACTRAEFRRLSSEGAVDASTPVIDLSVRRLGDLRALGIERTAGSSWHARVFDLAPAADTSTERALESS